MHGAEHGRITLLRRDPERKWLRLIKRLALDRVVPVLAPEVGLAQNCK
jgi:hypothetical protein